MRLGFFHWGCNFNSTGTLPTLVQYFMYSNRAGRPLIAYSLCLLCALTNYHNAVAIKENMGCNPCSSFHNKLHRPYPFDRLSSTFWRTKGKWFSYHNIQIWAYTSKSFNRENNFPSKLINCFLRTPKDKCKEKLVAF